MKLLFVLTAILIVGIDLFAKESPKSLLENLPERILFFEAGKITLYDKPELGASKKYSKELRSSTTWASVYVYDQGLKNISQNLVEKSYEMAYQDITTFYNKAIRIDENRGSWNLKLNKFRTIKINYAWFEIVKGDGSKVSTYLFVAGDDHYIYKIRISSEKKNKSKFSDETLPSKKISADPMMIYFVEHVLESLDGKLNGALEEDENALKYKQSSLHQAVASQNLDAVKDLPENHAEIDIVDKLGRTPLHYAAISGYVEIAELLLDRGANINAVDQTKQWTPLSFATFMHHKEMVKLLIERGADKYIKEEKLGHKTVYDAKTGLMWQYNEFHTLYDADTDLKYQSNEFDTLERDMIDIEKNSKIFKPKGKQKNWQEAVEYCDLLVWAGYDDWGLPTKKELQSFASNPPHYYSCIDENTTIFPPKGPDPAIHWSATIGVLDESIAWVVDLNHNSADRYFKTRLYYIRCVRNDKDLEAPVIPSLEGKVLISRCQLDSLAKAVESITTAVLMGMITGGDLFTSSWKVEAMIARDSNKVKQAKRMADTGLVLEFLEGISYQSQFMAITNELWNSWSIDKQNEFMNTLSEKVESYRKIYNTPEVWIQLNREDGLDEYVYPLSLDLLP